MMENVVLNQLIDRRSVRVFTDRPISDEEKQAILLAAANAPTAGNQQLYTILDITDQALKEALVKTCDNQPFIASAPMVLVFCADCRKWYRGFEDADCNPRAPGVGDLLLAVSDTNIAAQNAVTAAWSMGIGSCYIGDVMENCEEQRRLLKLPRWVFPAAMVVFGFPTEQQRTRKKPERAPLDTIVAENTYPEMDSPYLRRLFSESNRPDYLHWMHAFCARKFNSDFSREMTRSVAEYLKDFSED